MAVSQRPWTSQDWRILRQSITEAAEVMKREVSWMTEPSIEGQAAGCQQAACCFYAVSALVAMGRVRRVELDPVFELARITLFPYAITSLNGPVGTVWRLADHWLRLPEKLLWDSDFAGTVLQLVRTKARLDWKNAHHTIDAGLSEQILLTQVSTPQWLVEFMTNETLGKELQMRGGRKRRGRVEGALPTVLDPACGSGRFSLCALSMLVEWLSHGQQYSRAKAAHLGLVHLFGLEIDPIALGVCQGQLLLKAMGDYGCTDAARLIETLCRNFVLAGRHDHGILGQAGSLINHRVAQDFGLGPEWQSGPRARTYDVVLMNPPYLDKREYGPELKTFLARYYPESRGNLFGAFLQRMVEFCRPGGRWAAITPQSWLYLRSYVRLRRFMIEENCLDLMIHFGMGVFAETVDTAAMIGRRQPQADWKLVCVDLFTWHDKAQALQTYLRTGEGKVYEITKSELIALPDYEFCYQFSPGIRALFRRRPALSSVANIALGMKTSDNKRFLRYWWEVRLEENSGGRQGRWVPYDKETSGYPFYRAPRFVVDWSPAAVFHYQTHYSAQLPNPKFWFAEGITFGMLSSRGFAAKYLPPGQMTDMASNLVLPHDKRNTWFLLGFLNSRLAGYLLHNLNPSINFQVRDVSRLPFAHIDSSSHRYISAMVRLVVQIQRMRDSWDETSPEFSGPLLLRVSGGDLMSRLARAWELVQRTSAVVTRALETIDTVMLDVYGLYGSDRRVVSECRQAGMIRVLEQWNLKRTEWEWRQLHTLVSYAVGCVLGWRVSGYRQLPNTKHEANCRNVKEWLQESLGADAVFQLETLLGQTLDRYLLGEFVNEHRRRFGGRPVFVPDGVGGLTLVSFVTSVKEPD